MRLSPSQAGPAQGRAGGRSAERLTHCNGNCDCRRAPASARSNCALPRGARAATSLLVAGLAGLGGLGTTDQGEGPDQIRQCPHQLLGQRALWDGLHSKGFSLWNRNIVWTDGIADMPSRSSGR